MSIHSANQDLLSLRETIESNLYEKIEDDMEITEVADEILGEASTIIEKARHEQELIAIYEMLATQLQIVSEDCESLGNAKLGYIQRYISDALYECIKPYLPHNISNTDLIKLLWPHNCRDVTSLKDVFREYIFIHALVLGLDDMFTDEFVSMYKVELEKAKEFRDLVRVYEEIREEARARGFEYYEKGNLEDAWKYGVLSRVIGFLLSDFEHCLSAPTGTFKWFGLSSVYL